MGMCEGVVSDHVYIYADYNKTVYLEDVSVLLQLDFLSIAAQGCSSTRSVGDQFSFRDQFWKDLIKLQTGHQSKI